MTSDSCSTQGRPSACFDVCVAPTTVTSREFALRARMYSHLDRSFGWQTRFFAAASVTNAALGALCTYRYCLPFVEASTYSFLSAAGRVLQHANLRCVGNLERSCRPVVQLDRKWVAMEQALLEEVLRTLRIRDATRCRGMIRQLDRILGWCALGPSLLWRNSSLRLFSIVLRAVRRDLGRPPSFAIYDERVQIGWTLIRHLHSSVTASGLRDRLSRHEVIS